MFSWLALAFILSLDSVGAGAGRAACVGDCDEDGKVDVGENVLGVGIALGRTALSRCPQLDRNGDRAIGIDELIASVDSSVNSCEPSAGGLRLEPVGGEFRLSAATLGLRDRAQVAMDDDGDFIAIWGDTRTDEDNFGLAGRHFESDGSPSTPLDFAVNTFTLDVQRTQDVTLQANGSGLAVWETSGIFLEDNDVRAGIYGRHFDTSGMPLVPDFKINTNDVDDVREDQPVVAPLKDGSFMVAWSARDNFIGGHVLVSARRVDANGLPVGDEFQVTQYTGFQDHPAIAPLPGGGFVIVWQDAYRDGLSSGIFGQRFNSAAGRVGSEFLVNDYTFGQQRLPVVAPDADGGFLVSWSGIVIGDEQIIARRFDGNGQPSGPGFEVNRTGELGQQYYSSVAAEPGGGFIVVWTSGGSIGRFNIFGRRVGRNGDLVGDEFQVNSFTSTTSNRNFPEVASNPDGSIVVVWEAQAQDGGTELDMTIRGQRYRLVDPAAGPRLVTLSRDGKMASLDIAAPWTVRATGDLASTVASARCRAGRCLVVHPSPADSISIVDASDLSLIDMIGLERDSDPRDVALVDDHTAVVSLYGEAELLVMNLDTGQTSRVDLSALADDDGLPESLRLANCGRRVFVQLLRVDHKSGAPSSIGAVLAVVDLDRAAGDQLVDADPNVAGVQGVALADRPNFDMPIDCGAGVLYVAEPRLLMQGGGDYEQVDLDSLTASVYPVDTGAEVGGFEVVEPDKYWLITHTTTGPGPSSHLNFFEAGSSDDTFNTFAMEHINDLAFDAEEDLLFYPDGCFKFPANQSCDAGVIPFHAHTGERASSEPVRVGFAPVEVAVSR